MALVWHGSTATPKWCGGANGPAASPFHSGFLHRTPPASKIDFRGKLSQFNCVYENARVNCQRGGLWKRGSTLLGPLGRLPKRLHLIQAGIGGLTALGLQRGFDEFEAAGEFGVRGAKGRLRIDL